MYDKTTPRVKLAIYSIETGWGGEGGALLYDEPCCGDDTADGYEARSEWDWPGENEGGGSSDRDVEY